jgi:hypothetical protein
VDLDTLGAICGDQGTFTSQYSGPPIKVSAHVSNTFAI